MIESAVLIVDKGPEMTSHDVVDRVRRLAGHRRVGHAGTLDPDATGVLVILIGRATKLSSALAGDDKVYRGDVVLGIETDTLDASGRRVAEKAVKAVDRAELARVFSSFTGRIMQTPPIVSAIKVRGTPLYKLARRNMDTDIKPPMREVTIRRLTLLEVTQEDTPHPIVRFEVECSKGTYVRSLAADIGRALGCGGHLDKLVRLRSGRFTIEQAHSLDELEGLAKAGRLEEALLQVEV